MKSIPSLALLVILAVGTATADIIIRDGIVATSLVRVIASPEQYAGKRIMITGYYVAAFEHSAIYITRDDARVGNPQQSLWIGGPKEGYDVKYPRKGFISVVGTLKYKSGEGAGHMGIWLGEIVDVEFLRIHK